MFKFLLLVGSLGLFSFIVYFLVTHSPKSYATSFLSSSTIYSLSNKVVSAQPDTDFEIEEIVNSYVQKTPAILGIGIKNIDTHQEYFLNRDTSFLSASLYKLIVMYAIFYEGKLGHLDISSTQIQKNLEAMITISSNEAAISLAEQLGWDRVDEIAKQIGMKNTSLVNPITTTPEDITNLLTLIVRDRALDPESSQAMKDLLLRQKINDRIPAYLPKQVQVAHKTGELDDVRHDAGIVFGPKSTYVITLMSKQITSETEIKKLMASLSLDVFNYFEK